MKKLSILLLLPVFLASPVFAIEGVGDFTGGITVGFDNALGGNDGALGISIEPCITFIRAFNELGISISLGDVVYIPTDKDRQKNSLGDELYVNVIPFVSAPLGPGEFGFSLGFQANIPLTTGIESFGLSGLYLDGDPASAIGLVEYTKSSFRFDPSFSYGFTAGFGSLGLELGTEHFQLSMAHKNINHEKEYSLDRLPIYFQAGFDLSFGLGLWVKPVFGIQMDRENENNTINPDAKTGFDSVTADIHYTAGTFSVGVQCAVPLVKDGIKNDGIDISPYGEFSIKNLDISLAVETAGLFNDADPAKKDFQIKPVLGLSYSF
jgi:hypothetical protein